MPAMSVALQASVNTVNMEVALRQGAVGKGKEGRERIKGGRKWRLIGTILKRDIAEV